MSLNIESTTVKKLAETEGVEEEFIKKGLKNGYIVLLQNVAREDVKICGIGLGLHTKVNANLGTSADLIDPVLEKEKAKVAVKSGADSIMDLSSAGSLDEIRRMILKTVKVPLGTVPVYQAALEAREQKDAIINMDEDDIFRSIEKHVKDGVDFITVHCGVTKNTVEEIIKRGRLMGIVSRGGAFHAATIIHTGEENPLYKNYDYLLEICKEYNTTLSLGDGIRPGCLEDANDSPQIAEMLVISELVERARKAGVQAMVEGP
ncbi:MAG: phosphomethylpyrimidine synthase ThiC, partial [Candidatus Wukongarchaeota archaeon]|nr:phosphomethylpyrimidine synthase ThiC [Candidatus Wukongarchaeota archaeon]